MKKFFLLIILIFSLNFAASASSDTARSRIFYENSGLLIITHPQENNRTTISSHMSFLGASDPAFPLYINGAEVAVTANGFFTYYAGLELGDNEFVFINGESSQSIVVTRQTAGTWTPPETIYFTVEIYGSTEYDNISRFANLDDDLNALTPLVRGTTFRILAEHDDMYIIEDGTAVFKDSVYQLDYLIPPITVSGGEVAASANDVSITFNVTDYPLYEIELNDNKALLTLFAANDLTDLQPDEIYITDISSAEHETAIAREFEFTRPPVGYTVDFSGGTMTVKFRFAPTSLSEAFVLLDAGHGGPDPGALGPPGEFGPMEKDFNLYVAEVTRDELRRLGIEVILIRDTDEFVQIRERTEYFSLEPDISVCIHANSMPLSADFSRESGPLMFFTLDISEQAADEMITLIASEISAYDESGDTSSLSRRQNFAMSRYTGGPSMLFEMGFLCNPEDYEAMLDTDYLDRTGAALAKAIVMQLTEGDELSTIDDEPEPAETEPAEIIYEPDGEDAQPVFGSAAYSDDVDSALALYIILISSVFFCGSALYLPSLIKRRK